MYISYKSRLQRSLNYYMTDSSKLTACEFLIHESVDPCTHTVTNISNQVRRIHRWALIFIFFFRNMINPTTSHEGQFDFLSFVTTTPAHKTFSRKLKNVRRITITHKSLKINVLTLLD